MVADISNHLADLDRLLLNELRTLARFGAEVLQLQELRLSKDRPDAIIQVVQPFSDSIFIHKGTNPNIGLLFEVHGFLHDLIRHGDDFGVRLIATLESDDSMSWHLVRSKLS